MTILHLTSAPFIHTPNTVRFILAGGHHPMRTKGERAKARAWQVEALGGFGLCPELAGRLIDRTVAAKVDPAQESLLIEVPADLEAAQCAFAAAHLARMKRD